MLAMLSPLKSKSFLFAHQEKRLNGQSNPRPHPHPGKKHSKSKNKYIILRDDTLWDGMT